MLTLIRSTRFDTWLRRLADQKARARILARLTSAAQGHFGDCKAVGAGVSEMRVHTGPGYRLYFSRTDLAVYVFLVGGDKSTQARDIEAAKQWRVAWERTKMNDEFAALDIASHLDNEEIIADYLTAAAEEDDPRVLLAAMAEVAKSRGLAQVAAAAGIGRESLAAALSGDGAPSFGTIRAVLRGLGVKMTIEPAR